MNIKVKSPYSLKHSLECGQAFRWETRENSYIGVIDKDIAKVSQEKDSLNITLSSKGNKSFIQEYLDVDSDIKHLLKKIDVDDKIHNLIIRYKGLRILRQQPWECMISFIISSYNNIPRIKKIISNISGFYGNKIALNGYMDFSFPNAKKLASAKIHDLRRLGLGYRAEYLVGASSKFLNEKKMFFSLYDKSYEEAKEYLLSYPGIGEKVADCILLFAFNKYEAFPVDIRIRKIMQELYFKGRATPVKKMREFAREHFGGFCGYAQQYLYHYQGQKRKTN